MCITVTNEHPEPTGVGYKVFDKVGRFLGSDCISSLLKRPMRKWLNEKDYRPSYKSSLPYKQGWHIFQSLGSASKWCHASQVIRRVRYRRAIVAGRLEFKPVVVAKEIFILPGEVT